MNGYPLKLYDKQGFRNPNGNPVVILDKRGKVFYDTRELDNRVFEFNLPPGDYIVVAGRIQPRLRPVEYAKMPLPNPERQKRGNPEHFEIVFAENPNKCSVDWLSRQIIYDHAFKDAELPTVVFIYLHECGHRYYETEEYCDAYAYNRMIEQGYNPSQIGLTMIDTLSDRANDRKAYIVNGIVNTKPMGKLEVGSINHFDFIEYDDADKNAAVEIGLNQGLFPSNVVGLYAVNDKVTKLYDVPGGSENTTKSARPSVIGKITGLNTTRNWAKVYDVIKGKDLWINSTQNPNLKFAENYQNGKPVKLGTPAPELTPLQQAQLILQANAGTGALNAAGAVAAAGAEKVADTTLNASAKLLEIIDWIVEHAGTILLIVVALILIFIFKR